MRMVKSRNGRKSGGILANVTSLSDELAHEFLGMFRGALAKIDEKILSEKSARKRGKLVANRDKMQEKLDGAYAKIDEKEGQLFNLVIKSNGASKEKDCDES